jgi:hypothetical protein
MDRWQVLLNTIEIKISPISHNKDYRLGDMFFMRVWNNGGLMLIWKSQSTEKKP